MKLFFLAFLLYSCNATEANYDNACSNNEYEQDNNGIVASLTCKCYNPCYPMCILGTCGPGVLDELPDGGDCYVCYNGELK